MTTASAVHPDRIVSGSGLLPLLKDGPDDLPLDPGPPGPACVLGLSEVTHQLLPRWRDGVARQTKALVRRSRSMLEVLTGETLYARLDDPLHRRAALVCELFRNHQASSNAGRLDTRTLQQHVAAALSADGPLRFELAWGQAKRDVGGLKTPGWGADLAEVFAIGRLAALVRAARELSEDDRVSLAVFSGGQRFAPALLTRPELLEAYDAQRRRIAEALAGPGVLEFGDYARAKRSGAQEQREHEARVQERLDELTDEEITAQLPVILLNIDWANVLPRAADGEAVHGARLAPAVARWLRHAREERTALLTRAAVTCAVAPERQVRWLAAFDEQPDVLEDAVSFVLAVGWAAARRYIAISRADRAITAREHDPRTVRLTVHEKRDRRDMPALLTLGTKGGAQLSQHVIARLGADGGPISFASVAETRVRTPEAAPVLLADDVCSTGGDESPLLDWLAEAGHPLCYAAGPEKTILRSMGKALDPEQG